MSLVVELEEGGGVGVVVLEVEVVDLGLGGGVPAVLAHVHLGTSGKVRSQLWFRVINENYDFSSSSNKAYL